MTHVEYVFTHVIPTWFQSFRSNFRIWADLMTSNYDGYALMKEDDPESECIEWFWASINEDDVYPKEFLEELQQMVKDIDSGKVKTYSMDELLDQLKNDLKTEDFE